MRDAEIPLADRLRQLPVGERPRVLSGVLRDRISEAIGLDPPDVGPRDRLMDLGVNSMKAVELKMAFERELALPLSSSVLFDCPTIESLTAFLLEQVGLGQGRSTRGEAPTSHVLPGAIAERRSSLNDDAKSVAELLAEELEDLRRGQRPF